MRHNVLKMVPCSRESNSRTSRPHTYHAWLHERPPNAWICHTSLLDMQQLTVLLIQPPCYSHHLLPAHACNRTRRHDRKLICCCFQWYVKGLCIVGTFLASDSMQCTYSDGCNNVIIFVFWQSTCLHVHAVWKELRFILPVDQLTGNEIKGTWLIHSI